MRVNMELAHASANPPILLKAVQQETLKNRETKHPLSPKPSLFSPKPFKKGGFWSDPPFFGGALCPPGGKTLLFMILKAWVFRVATWSVAQMSLCETQHQERASHLSWGVLTRYRDMGYRTISRDMGPLSRYVPPPQKMVHTPRGRTLQEVPGGPLGDPTSRPPQRPQNL